MTEPSHSKFSASAASRWLACPGSIPLSAGKPDSTSSYAAWGTVAHSIADHCIINALESVPLADRGAVYEQDGYRITVDDEMQECVNAYLQHVAELSHGADLVQSETRTNYSQWLGVPEDQGWGTADLTAVWIEQRHLLVADLKTGQGVEVEADDNEQLMLYGGGKLAEMDDLGIEVDTVDLAVIQPRVRRAPSVWRISADDLRAWLTGRARSGAVSVEQAIRLYPDATEGALPAEWQDTFLHPGEEQCRWCKAKATCPKLRDAVAETVCFSTPASPDEFEAKCQPITPHDETETTWLAAALSKVDMIEDWCKAVRAEVERRLLAGENVPGFKLVAGKRGARQWTDAEQAEAALKTFRLKVEEMYDLKLISPTTAEKLAKAETLGPRQWKKLQDLIVQKDGAPHVAPLSDKRPALEIKPVEDEFSAAADESDLV